MVILALLACKGPATETDGPVPAAGQGLVGDHILNPFPVGALHMADGRVALEPEWFDLTTPTALPTGRVGWREGFSVAQTSVLALPGLDPSGFPDWRNPTPGAGSVRLADLTEGVWLPVYAELDAHPDAVSTLLVRPLVAAAKGHEVAVVVTTDAADPVDRFHALISEQPPSDLAGHAESYRSMMEQLESMGTPRSEVAIAWSYPVGDGTQPTRSVWDQTALPTAWSFDDVRTIDAGDTVVPGAFKVAVGSFEGTNFLEDDRRLVLDAEGAAAPQGMADVYLYVHVPESVADAPAGSVPVVVIGHGIFSEPLNYLGDPEDPSHVVEVVGDGEFIAVATVWRGLAAPDLGGVLEVAQDFGRMHEVTDRLVQAQANMAELMRLMNEGDLFDDPVFQGRSGQSLVDPAHLRYYGISLGGIEGAVMLANDPPLDAAVLHVGGSMWSTMLERSSNWTGIEIFLDQTMNDPLLRQRAFATTQLWWDSVDPIAFSEDLATRDFLLQEALGDAQVPNMTTRALALSTGLAHLGPVVEPVWELEVVDGPLPAGSRAYVQFDPQDPLPPDINRPPPVTDAHTDPRTWSTTNRQTLDYLSVDAPRQVVHPCGDEPCREDNATLMEN